MKLVLEYGVPAQIDDSIQDEFTEIWTIWEDNRANFDIYLTGFCWLGLSQLPRLDAHRQGAQEQGPAGRRGGEKGGRPQNAQVKEGLGWWAYSYYRLRQGTKTIAKGDLEYQIDTRRMPYDLREPGR